MSSHSLSFFSLVLRVQLSGKFKQNRTSHRLLDSFLCYCSQEGPRYSWPRKEHEVVNKDFEADLEL